MEEKQPLTLEEFEKLYDEVIEEMFSEDPENNFDWTEGLTQEQIDEFNEIGRQLKEIIESDI